MFAADKARDGSSLLLEQHLAQTPTLSTKAPESQGFKPQTRCVQVLLPLLESFSTGRAAESGRYRCFLSDQLALDGGDVLVPDPQAAANFRNVFCCYISVQKRPKSAGHVN